MNSNETYNSFFASHYDQLYTLKKNYLLESLKIESLFCDFGLTKSSPLLDVGCGTGEHAYNLAKQGYSVTGLDISPSMIKEALKKKNKSPLLSLDFSCCTPKNLPSLFPYAYSMFNVINCLYDFEDLIIFFKDISSSINPGGIYIFDTWNTKVVLKNPPQIKHDKAIVYKKLIIERHVVPTFDISKNTFILNYNYNFLHSNGKNQQNSVKHRIKLFTLDEIKKALLISKFKILNVFNNIVEQQSPTSKDRHLCFLIEKSNT